MHTCNCTKFFQIFFQQQEEKILDGLKRYMGQSL